MTDEPITREVYLAVLSMLGADVHKTRNIHLSRSAVTIEEYTEPRVLNDEGDVVVSNRVVPVVENGYTARARG